MTIPNFGKEVGGAPLVTFLHLDDIPISPKTIAAIVIARWLSTLCVIPSVAIFEVMKAGASRCR
jgi:hypothetical protein